ncbi:MAG: hypothetical protein ACYSTS_18115 [Planctomycetota bacterium]|jgi:hypothetical protein
MSYVKAKEIINNNLNYINAESDPVSHNLSTCLYHLTEAIEADFSKIQMSLHQIATRLKDLEQK